MSKPQRATGHFPWRAVVFTVLSIALVVAIAVTVAFTFFYQHTSADRPENLYGEPIAGKSSATGDAIVEGALAYARTGPKYASKYYQGGKPDDGYGVCTDLVAAALENAGFDLQNLVDADIRAHPERYNVPTPDPNIDYRRVDNLLTYFEANAENLPTDLGELNGWQPGDIVIFPQHIGVVSDRRDAQGIPYLIHHEGPWQRHFENDALVKRRPILGHFRLQQ